MVISGVPVDSVEWRRLQKRLWVARSDGSPVGSIERGRRYVVTGADGTHRGGYRTLAQAQEALVVAVDAARPDATPRSPLMLACTALIGSAALLGSGLAGLMLLTAG